MPRSDFQQFVRDAALLLILPAIGLVGLLVWWNPWKEPWRGYQDYSAQVARESAARAAGARNIPWEGLTVRVSDAYVLTTTSNRVEAIEATPSAEWPSRMAILQLDSTDTVRFAEAAGNCSLDINRCWTDTVDTWPVACQRSSGVPDPALDWTPHVECQAPHFGFRMAANGPSATLIEFEEFFRAALRSAP